MSASVLHNINCHVVMKSKEGVLKIYHLVRTDYNTCYFCTPGYNLSDVLSLDFFFFLATGVLSPSSESDMSISASSRSLRNSSCSRFQISCKGTRHMLDSMTTWVNVIHHTAPCHVFVNIPGMGSILTVSQYSILQYFLKFAIQYGRYLQYFQNYYKIISNIILINECKITPN